MDAIDEQIITALTHNARISHAELGQRVRLSRNAVRQRVERLERQGHIGGYTIVRPSCGPDRATVAAHVMVYREDRMRGGDVLTALKRIPEVVSCDVLSGQFDCWSVWRRAPWNAYRASGSRSPRCPVYGTR